MDYQKWIQFGERLDSRPAWTRTATIILIAICFMIGFVNYLFAPDQLVTFLFWGIAAGLGLALYKRW